MTEVTYKKNKNGTVDMQFYFEYAKLFDVEGAGSVDRGDPVSTQAWLRALAKCPEAKLNAYFMTEADMEALIADPDFKSENLNPTNGQMVSVIKDGNPELGCGKYIQLKAKEHDIREIVDRKTKEIKEIDFGGFPPVKVAVKVEDDGVVSEWADYDYEDLGPIGNGSKGKVRFHPKYKRLTQVGVIELIEYTEGSSFSDDF